MSNSNVVNSKVLIAIIGQSNEAGSNVGTNSNNGVLGCPQQSTNGQIWPRLSGLLGIRNIWAEFYNAAVGSTNLTDMWVGRCRSYVISMVVANGSYVIDGGILYKAVGVLGTTYILNVPPSVGIGTSGLTSWTNLGAVTGEDIDKHIYTFGSSRFDPNGLIAGIITNTNSRVGFNEKWLFVSIGQGDKTLLSTSNEFRDALVSVANYFTGLGYRVFLGFTCYGATVGLDAWYTSDLLPGRLAALSSLSSNYKVHAGADLRTDLGVLPVSPTVTSTGRGLLVDSLHMNQLSIMDAADAWNTQLQSLGF